RESLEIQRELGGKAGIAGALENVAGLACGLQRWAEAARLYAAAEALRGAIQAPRPGSQSQDYERNLAALRGALDGAAFDSAWNAGRVMPLEEAVALALAPPSA